MVGCSLPISQITDTIDPKTLEPADPIAPYREFFQGLIDQPMSQLMEPHFIDYKELPGAFAVSAALVDLTGDDTPEVLIAYTSDIPGADAQTYTQMYQLKGDKIVPWGQKLPITIEFYGLNQLIGTKEKHLGKQMDRTYQQYQVVPELVRVAEGSLSVIIDQLKPSDASAFEPLVSLAKTMATGSSDDDLLIMDRADQSPPFIIYNSRTFDQSRLSSLAERFDLRFISWRSLNSEFLAQLGKYFPNPDQVVSRQETMVHNEVDLMSAAIEREMQSGNVKSFTQGDNTYFYISELEMRGMRQFRLIKAIIDDTEVYLDQQIPFFMRDDERDYYLDDKLAQSKFLSLHQKLRTDVSRYLFRQFLLLDHYDWAVPLSGYELLPETKEEE